MTKRTLHDSFPHRSSVIRHSSLADDVISSAEQLRELIPHVDCQARVAVDTEADSLHCYREKLCLLQVSLPEGDFLVDPLAGNDLSRLADVLSRKEIVLHGADYDLRLLRRGLVLEAHENLVTADESNRTKFQDVMAFLKNRVAQK